jgi:MYND finger
MTKLQNAEEFIDTFLSCPSAVRSIFQITTFASTMSTSYDGKFSGIRELPCCGTCGREAVVDGSPPLMRCGRCQIIYYCSSDCQKRDFPTHKTTCLALHRDKENMEREAAVLRNHSEWGEEPHNYFETSVGHFWVRSKSIRYWK